MALAASKAGPSGNCSMAGSAQPSWDSQLFLTLASVLFPDGALFWCCGPPTLTRVHGRAKQAHPAAHLKP